MDPSNIIFSPIFYIPLSTLHNSRHFQPSHKSVWKIVFFALTMSALSACTAPLHSAVHADKADMVSAEKTIFHTLT